MDKMTMLERLISIKINADERARYRISDDQRYNSHVTKANLLESGIIQLIIEIQNTIVAEQINLQIKEANEWKNKQCIKTSRGA